MIISTPRRSVVLAALMLAIGVFWAVPCLAQFGNGAGEALQSGRRNRGQAPEAPVIQPPGLPGVRNNPTAVAPALRSPTDMAPTEALFDAINRGDLAVARDAVMRGADLNARNALGLTSTELAVDLGRNEIAFLLLSLRAETDRGARDASTAAAASRPVNDRKPQPVRAAPVQPTPTTPRLFAGDGGTPIPSIGFLGFDAGRALR